MIVLTATAAEPHSSSRRPSWLSRQLKWGRSHPSTLVRYLLQATFVAVIARAAHVHLVWEAANKAGPSSGASVDSLCPLGALETFWSWATTGSLLPHMHPSSLIMGLALALALLLVGPAFCGWVCPFGTMQEWLFKLSRKLPFLRRRHRPIKVELPGAWEKRLRLMRYVVLAMVLGFTWYLGSLVFQDYDPYRALFSLGSSEVAVGALVVLGVTAAGSLVIERFWCRYLCPLGAVSGILAKLSLVRIRRQPASCIDCNLCTQACYADIPVATSPAVNDTACTGCLSCVEACPRPTALKLEVPLWRRSRKDSAASSHLSLEPSGLRARGAGRDSGDHRRFVRPRGLADYWLHRGVGGRGRGRTEP